MLNTENENENFRSRSRARITGAREVDTWVDLPGEQEVPGASFEVREVSGGVMPSQRQQMEVVSGG